MRRTDNTWEHVERITITDSNTRKHRNTNFLSQTLLPHTIITIHKGILYPTLLRNFAQLLTLPCYFLFGHWHRRTQMHMHTDSSGSFSPYPTGAWTDQSSLFKRGCFEFQRGAHERAAEYKGVPKDTLQRSM